MSVTREVSQPEMSVSIRSIQSKSFDDISDKRSSGSRRRAAPSQHPIPIGTTVAPSMHKPQMQTIQKHTCAAYTARSRRPGGGIEHTDGGPRGPPGGSRRLPPSRRHSPQRASVPRAPSEKRASSSCSCAPHGRRVTTPGSRSTKQRLSPDLQREGRHESSALEHPRIRKEVGGWRRAPSPRLPHPAVRPLPMRGERRRHSTHPRATPSSVTSLGGPGQGRGLARRWISGALCMRQRG